MNTQQFKQNLIVLIVFFISIVSLNSCFDEDITIKQIKRIKEWERKHPDYLHNDKLLQEWHKMIQQITGNGGAAQEKEQIKKSLGNTIEIKDAMVIDN